VLVQVQATDIERQFHTQHGKERNPSGSAEVLGVAIGEAAQLPQEAEQGGDGLDRIAQDQTGAAGDQHEIVAAQRVMVGLPP
jgi:hypothetical protein